MPSRVRGVGSLGDAQTWPSSEGPDRMAGKYDPLRLHLDGQRTNRVDMTFDEVADLVAGLPGSAFRYPAWWANDVSHVQGKAWIEAGYLASPDLGRQRVSFRRTI
jgi:hypothetical protein